MPKICDMEGVREYLERETVELWRNEKYGRLTIRAYNERGNNFTDVDLCGLIEWLAFGPFRMVLVDASPEPNANGLHPTRDREGL